MIAMRELTKPATGTVKVGCYKGNIFFLSLTGVEGTLYNEADSSMEASDGLNPVSSQGYAEVQSVEARSLARAGQVGAHAIEQPSESQPPPSSPLRLVGLCSALAAHVTARLPITSGQITANPGFNPSTVTLGGPSVAPSPKKRKTG